MTSKDRRSRRWLVAILFLSVILRLGVALYLGDVVDAPPLLTDQRSYHALGARLLGGHGYSFEQPWYPFTPADTPTAFWSFLYPLFVAAVYALFGGHPLAVRLVQAVLGGILLPWMVYRLAKQMGLAHRPPPPPPDLTATPLPLSRERERGRGAGGEGVRVTAAALAALYGYFILYAATLMTETFFITTLLWSLELAIRLGKRLRTRQPLPISISLQLGLSLGLAALLRQSILPWVPLLFLWLLWQGLRSSKGESPTTSPGSDVPTPQPSNLPTPHAATLTPERRNIPTLLSLTVAGLVLLACILPWTYRNYRVFGQFLLLNSNTGYAMYSAQHPMHGTRFSEFAAAPLPDGLTGENEAQLDRELLRASLQFIRQEPGRYLLLSLSRVRAYFEFWPTPDTTLLHNIGRSGSFGLFLPFMLYGVYRALRTSKFEIRNSKLGLSLIYLFAAFYSLLHIFTWAMVRYRLPVDAVLLPFAALALQDLYARARRRWAPSSGS